MILGIKWLQTLGNVTVNWKLLTTLFMGDHGLMTLKGDPSLCRSRVSFKLVAMTLQVDGERIWIKLRNLSVQESTGGST